MILNNVKMNAIETAPNGVVNHLTIFNFSEDGRIVSAIYSGGLISRGYLVGAIEGNKLSFSFCQIDNSDSHHSGRSICDISFNTEGKLRLTEHFVWDSNDLKAGVNILQEL
jgi:hypothetical protein